MSDTIIINYPTDEGLTINIDDNDDVIVNIIDEPDIIVYLCDDNGTTPLNYDNLDNKPSINNVELVGNKTLDDLGIEPKRGNDDFYITNAEKTQGALATGNAVLPTVKQVADRTDRLLVDFTVPIDTTSITFDRDKNGVLFSNLNLKGVFIITYIISGQTIVHINVLQINNITSGYTSGLNNTNGFASANSNYAVTYYDLAILNNICSCNTIRTDYTALNTSPRAQETYNGFVFNVNNVTTLKLTTLGQIIKSGSLIKIYRND